jgi:hypothetical protein
MMRSSRLRPATVPPTAAPSLGCADAAVVAANCSWESLIAFVNGQTGATNPSATASMPPCSTDTRRSIS